MSAVKSFWKTQTVLYDFSKDGGAIGTIQAGINIPAGCFVYSVTAEQRIAMASAGAIFQMGWAGNLGGLFASAVPFVPLNGSQVQNVISPGGAVIFTISVGTIIAGKVLFDIGYYERRLP